MSNKKINRLKIVILSVIIIALLFSILFWYSHRNIYSLKTFEEMGIHQIEITNDENQTLIFIAKIADDVDEQEAGFQYINQTTIENTIILFIFKSDIYGDFHMQNVESPLDIAFIKSNGIIIAIMSMNMSATKTYSPNEEFRYAIEARADFFKDNKISANNSSLIIGSLP